MLNLLALGALLGRPSLSGAASLVGQYGRELAILLGFRHYTVPSVATLSVLLRRLDTEQVEAAIRRWVAARMAEHGGSIDTLNIDGKTLRGSRDGETPGVHLLSAYASRHGAVVAQLRVDAKTNEHKAALELLGLLPCKLDGVVITGDAIFCQRDLCQKIRDGGGHYVQTIKDNQKRLVADIDAGISFGKSAANFPPSGRRAQARPAP